MWRPMNVLNADDSNKPNSPPTVLVSPPPEMEAVYLQADYSESNDDPFLSACLGQAGASNLVEIVIWIQCHAEPREKN